MPGDNSILGNIESDFDLTTEPSEQEESGVNDLGTALRDHTTIPEGVIEDIERLAVLRKEEKIKPEEYQILEAHHLKNISYSIESSSGDQQRPDPSSAAISVDDDDLNEFVNQLEGKQADGLVAHLWSIVPEDNYDNERKHKILSVEFGSEASVSVHHSDDGFFYLFFLQSRNQEESLRTAIDEYSYTVVDDGTGGTGIQSISLRFDEATEMFRPEFSDEELHTEAAHLLRLVKRVYDASANDLMFSE